MFPAPLGHFRGDISDSARFNERNPELVAEAVARIGIEHMGALGWEDGRPELTGAEGYAPTGLPQSGTFENAHQRLVGLLSDAVIQEDLRFIGPVRGGGGAGLPGTRFITGAPWMFNWGKKVIDEGTGDVTFTQNQEKVSRERMYHEFRTLVRIASQLDKIDLTTIPADQ